MADLLILFTPDKQSPAGEIARASAALGHAPELAKIVEPETLAARIRAAPAALLVWSRSLTAWAMEEGRIGALRQLPNLIEVSTDGIAPDTGEAGKVILLSGWRGQPHHLGWQRIADRLHHLVAARPARSARRVRTDALPARAPRSSLPARRIALPAIGLAALAAAIGAIAWTGSQAPAPARRAAPHDAAVMPSPATAPVTPRVEPLAPGPAQPAGLVTAAEPLAAAATEAASPAQTRARPAAYPRARRARSAAGPIKHYSRRNSKVMRRFCAGSGRSTPQCRIFLRSTRG